MSKDAIYATPQAHIVDFAFDERVASVFPDMIRRSVPGYSDIISLLGLFAEQYAQAGSTLYDLGCSLGAATLSLRRRITVPNCRIVAIDNPRTMVPMWFSCESTGRVVMVMLSIILELGLFMVVE